METLWQCEEDETARKEFQLNLIDVKKIIPEILPVDATFRLAFGQFFRQHWRPKKSSWLAWASALNCVWWLQFRPVIIISFLIPHQSHRAPDESRNLSQLLSCDEDILSVIRQLRHTRNELLCISHDYTICLQTHSIKINQRSFVIHLESLMSKPREFNVLY